MKILYSFLSSLHFTRDTRGEIVREGDCLDAICYFYNNQEKNYNYTIKSFVNQQLFKFLY